MTIKIIELMLLAIKPDYFLNKFFKQLRTKQPHLLIPVYRQILLYRCKLVFIFLEMCDLIFDKVP